MDETINARSLLGDRLKKIPKTEIMKLTYQGKSCPIITEITIGRDKSNNICLDDSLVSRFHALIQKIKHAYFLKDLDSTNGTLVNKKKVPRGKYIKLYMNDVIQVGRTEITIQ